MAQRVAIIPARYAASRLPGKPLIEIDGKAMIQHVYERAQSARSIDRTIVATDDHRIFEFVRAFGGEVAMTSTDHTSGTDRVAEVVRGLDDVSIVVNVQGDEPMLDPAILEALVTELESTSFECATPIAEIDTSRELFDPNIVKVVLRSDNTPLYFSRSPIPFVRERVADEWIDIHRFHRHVGVYAFRPDALARYVAAPATPLERLEQLEQLRMLELDIRLVCCHVEYDGIAVDTAEDVMRVEAHIQRM